MNKPKRDAYTFTENRFSKGTLARLRRIAYEKDSTLAKVIADIFKEHLEDKKYLQDEE